MEYKVILQPSGLEFSSSQEESLLVAATRQNIALEHSCGTGQCGACKAKVLSGQVEFDDRHQVLTEAEKASGVVLTCMTKALGAAVLGEPAVEPAKTSASTQPHGLQVRDGGLQRPDYSWSPHFAQSFGVSESFYTYQVGINGNADVALSNQVWASATLYLNLVDNYDKFNYTTPPSDTDALPRVRTWSREYVNSSNLLLNNLQLTAMDKLSDSVYGQAYGGYLEMMYAGVGSELLYCPYGSSWALGLDANYVQKRDWNNPLQLADYKVVTGHLTSYWQLPFVDNTLAKISIGRYVAGDYGTTIELSRRFDSGIIAGAFATFTNVSADEYGEGSFTKGFYFTIPFDLMLVKPTTRQGRISWIPLTRDGGQMLSRKYCLYTLTNSAN